MYIDWAVGFAMTFLCAFFWWIATRASEGLLLLGESPERAQSALVKEYIKDLSRVVRAHRWIGVCVLGLLAATVALMVWEASQNGLSAVLGLHVLNGSAFLVLSRFVFRRVDRYDNLLREALGISKP